MLGEKVVRMESRPKLMKPASESLLNEAAETEEEQTELGASCIGDSAGDTVGMHG